MLRAAAFLILCNINYIFTLIIIILLGSYISTKVSVFLWLALFVCMWGVYIRPRAPLFLYSLGLVFIMRMLFTLGPEPTLMLLGTANVRFTLACITFSQIVLLN